MAKIASSFKCLLCNQPLNFPNDISIIEFTIILLQFYRNHELCESLGNKPNVEDTALKAKAIIKKGRKKKGE